MQKSNNRFNKSRSTDKKPASKSGDSKPRFKKPYKSDSDFDKSRSDKPYSKRGDESGEKKSYRDRDSKPFSRDKKPFDRDKKPYSKREGSGDRKFDKPFKKREGGDDEKRSFRDRDSKSFDRDKKPYSKRESSSERKFDKPYKKREGGDDEKRSFRDRDSKPFDRDKKSYSKKEGSDERKFDKPYKKREGDNEHGSNSERKKSFDGDRGYKKDYKKHHDRKDKKKHEEAHKSTHDDGLIRLNKYLSNAGVCSRREADELIKAGVVTVNGKVVTEMGYRVDPSDKISYDGETLKHEKKVYLILNKPKDYITTTDDPRERRTVMELIKGACKERVYPVGRLDRNTTGLLLFTNDGEIATRLMQPKFNIKKVYHVLLDKNMKPADYAKLHEGVELEDGFIKPDDASFTGDTKKEIGIEIHSGKNRIVRRIFEHLGYEVVKLDRVVFAGLTKKDLPRGKWRFLNDKEVGFLKMIG